MPVELSWWLKFRTSETRGLNPLFKAKFTTSVHEPSWYIRGRVLWGRYWGVVTIDELRDCYQYAARLADTQAIPPSIHYIGDAREYRKGIGSLTELQKVSRVFTEHPMIGWGIVITENTFVRVLVSVGGYTARKTRIRPAKTPLDARSFLQETDATLPSPLPEFPPSGSPLRVFDMSAS